MPAPLGTTHSNAELLDQIRQLESQLGQAFADKAAFQEQAEIAKQAYNTQAADAVASRADNQSLALQLRDERTVHRKVRDRVEQIEQQLKLEKQANELLQEERRRERSFAELEDPFLTTARDKLSELGYTEAPRGFGWVPKDSPDSTRATSPTPSQAEQSLATHLIRERK